MKNYQFLGIIGMLLLIDARLSTDVVGRLGIGLMAIIILVKAIMGYFADNNR